MFALSDTAAMSDEWRIRLAAALKDSGKSKRAASLEAGLGSGYMHSILTEGKSPTIENLISVCKVLSVSPAYIMYGVDIFPEDAEIIEAMRADKGTRDAILSLLRMHKPGLSQ